MTTWFVTRHPGALEWAATQRLAIDRQVAHLDIHDIQAGDTVIGSLPVHLAARVCAANARYLHLELDVPRHLRGKELSAAQMKQCRARIAPYQVRKEDN